MCLELYLLLLSRYMMTKVLWIKKARPPLEVLQEEKRCPQPQLQVDVEQVLLQAATF